MPSTTMTLSTKTLDTLRLCSLIQPGLIFREDHRLFSLSTDKALLFEATILETFPHRFAISDVNALVLFADNTTRISFEEPGWINLRNGPISTPIRMAPESSIVSIPRPIREQHFSESLSLLSNDAHKLSRIQDERLIINIHAEAPGEPILLDFPYTYIDDEIASSTTLRLQSLSLANSRFRARIELPSPRLLTGASSIRFAETGVAQITYKGTNNVLWIALWQKKTTFNEMRTYTGRGHDQPNRRTLFARLAR